MFLSCNLVELLVVSSASLAMLRHGGDRKPNLLAIAVLHWFIDARITSRRVERWARLRFQAEQWQAHAGMVFADALDIHLLPKVGAAWMPKGTQLEVLPPGQNAKHDRLKQLFQRGFTPKRIAAHEGEIRAITVEVLGRLEGRETCDLVTDVAQPVVSRVIHSFMGIPPEDDETWARLMNNMLGAGDPDMNPEGVESVMQHDVP